MNLFEHFIPIPEIFWSFETGKPMEQCSICHCDLMPEGTNYLIEKAFKDQETIFEVAICTSCYEQHMQEISSESRERIDQYFTERVDLKKRTEWAMENFGQDIEKWLGHCMVKGYPQQECGTFHLYGYCIDQDLIFNGMPYILSSEVMDEITELLSPATLGTLHDFTERLFGIDAPKDLLII